MATGGEDSLRAARPEYRAVLSGSELAPYLALCAALVVMVLFPVEERTRGGCGATASALTRQAYLGRVNLVTGVCAIRAGQCRVNGAARSKLWHLSRVC